MARLQNIHSNTASIGSIYFNIVTKVTVLSAQVMESMRKKPKKYRSSQNVDSTNAGTYVYLMIEIILISSINIGRA